PVCPKPYGRASANKQTNTKICFSISATSFAEAVSVQFAGVFSAAAPMLRGEVRKGKKSNWGFAQMLMSWPHFLPFRIAFVLDACSNAPHNTLRLHLYTMKLFSVEEANALLPEIKRQWREIDAARATLRRLAPEAKRASEQTGGGGSV